MLRLIVYEDNDKLRNALELALGAGDEVHLCAAFPNCNTVAEDVRTFSPDVVLMDIDMPGVNGIQGARIIKETAPDVRVLMHTVFDEDTKIFNALAAGADGYLLKSISPVQLYAAISDVAGGGSPMSPGVARKVLDSFRQKAEAPEEDVETLTDREQTVLEMLTKGYTYRRISSECGNSIDTTRTHIKNIYTKLHVNCGTEAVAKALRLKLV